MDSMISLRLSPPVLERLDRITELLQERPDLAPEMTERGRVTRAAVVREFILKGLADLERKAKRDGK